MRAIELREVKNLATLPSVSQQMSMTRDFLTQHVGGSTIVLLLEKDSVVWDEDLLINGRASLETLVRVGMGIGKSVRPAVSE